MLRRSFLTVAAALVVASCGATTAPPALGPDGKPLPRAYRIPSGSSAEIEYSMLDSVNALRQARGVSPLTLNAKLNAAAATHSRDMSVQNRPWHFGSDGSSPIDRVRRVGYAGQTEGVLGWTGIEGRIGGERWSVEGLFLYGLGRVELIARPDGDLTRAFLDGIA